MSDDVRFERLLADVLSDVAPTRVPDRLVPDILAAASRTRRRPRWLALAIERPMRLDAAVVVGAPTLRVAYLLLLALLVALLAVGTLVAGGIVRPPELAVVVVPSPSLPGVVAPSSAPSGPSTGPTASPVTNPAGVWIATGTMGTPRLNHAAVRLLDGRVLVVGGSTWTDGADRSDVTSVELYDPDSGTWSATGNMLRPHDGFPATLLRDGRVLAGDVDDPAADNPVKGAEVYDPETGTWSETGSMVKDGGGTATLLRDGKVLVAGDSAQLYDPDSGTWTATGTMITPRYGHAAFLLPDGRVLVAGGYVVPDRQVESAELYDPATGTWTAIANWQHHAATLLRDGKVLTIDFEEPPGLYDPATGAWTATGAMARPGASYASATLLSDGMVLVMGDDGAELFDPGTGSWTTTAPMLRSRFNIGSPTLLLDGTVLVAGGDDPEGATGSAELYIPAGVSPPPDLAPVPSPTPRPSPTPTPTPFPPEAGPVPAGARSWKVTVVNKSSVPATLFLAEEGENGLRQLCGSVTPNVVPAGVTVKVTFLLPPKRVKSCWIWVNPVPGQGGSLFETSDAPMAGEILITADGQTGWLGP